MADDEFEWATEKQQTNLAERGVDFADAVQIFLGPVLEQIDKRADYGEQRFRALGRVADDYFMVAYTWRGSARRIITAWKVGENGKRRYQALLNG